MSIDIQAPRASSDCPICGVDTPHSHNEKEVALAIPLYEKLSQAIEQAEQEVPHCNAGSDYCQQCADEEAAEQAQPVRREQRMFMDEHELYTAPPPRQPLPAHEIVTMYEESPRSDSEMIAFARAIEAAHGIKGEA